jgi:hypothetical protein
MRTLTVLTIAAALAAATAGTATAQQAPSENGTSEYGPITILKNMQAEPGGVRVSIDGHEVDHLTQAVYEEITGVVHPGLNTLTVRWDGPIQRFDFKVAFAPTRNNFKNVLLVQSNAQRDGALRQAGSRSYTFTIPN